MIWKRLKTPDPEKEENLRKAIEEEGGLSHKDTFAMIVSAFLVILPVCTLALVGLYFLARLVFWI